MKKIKMFVAFCSALVLALAAGCQSAQAAESATAAIDTQTLTVQAVAAETSAAATARSAAGSAIRNPPAMFR